MLKRKHRLGNVEKALPITGEVSRASGGEREREEVHGNRIAGAEAATTAKAAMIAMIAKAAETAETVPEVLLIPQGRVVSNLLHSTNPGLFHQPSENPKTKSAFRISTSIPGFSKGSLRI